LTEALTTLVEQHLLDSYELTARTVTVHGDLDGMAIHIEEGDLAGHKSSIFTSWDVEAVTPRTGFSLIRKADEKPRITFCPEEFAAYYRQASQFLHTAAFRALSPFARSVWRLHCQGLTNQEIKLELSVPGRVVQVSVRKTRRLARLPDVAGGLLSLRGRKRTVKDACAGPCCKAEAVRLGLCNTHYMQMRRRGYLTVLRVA
jgi:hypothetical protein